MKAATLTRPTATRPRRRTAALCLFLEFAKLARHELRAGIAALESADPCLDQWLAWDLSVLEQTIDYCRSALRRENHRCPGLPWAVRRLAVNPNRPEFGDLDDLPAHVAPKVRTRFERYRHICMGLAWLRSALACLDVYASETGWRDPYIMSAALQSMASMVEGSLCASRLELPAVEGFVERIMDPTRWAQPARRCAG